MSRTDHSRRTRRTNKVPDRENRNRQLVRHQLRNGEIELVTKMSTREIRTFEVA